MSSARPSPHAPRIPLYLGEIWSERTDLRVAFPRLDSVDAERFLDWARTQGVREHHIPPERFEFQMLYGVRRSLQKRIVKEGFRLRIYVPYGEAWYPYFMRRLAERPANVLFLLRNLFLQ